MAIANGIMEVDQEQAGGVMTVMADLVYHTLTLPLNPTRN